MIIVDAEKLLQSDYTEIRALIRGNIREVYEADSEGVEIASLFASWAKLTPEERAKYEKNNMDTFIAKYSKRFGDAAKRLRRIFTTEGIREAATKLTKSKWGTDLFTEHSFDELARTHCTIVSACRARTRVLIEN